MSDDEDDYVPHTQFVRESGLGSQHYSINIDLNPDREVEVTETQDNTDILYNMRDLTRELVNKWLPAVAKWLEVKHERFYNLIMVTSYYKYLTFQFTPKCCHFKTLLDSSQY